MTEWAVVGVIIVMVGFAGTVLSFANKISKPMEQLNLSIVELSTKFNGLVDRIDRDGTANEKEHVALWDEAEKHGEAIQDHEIRLCVIEKGGGK